MSHQIATRLTCFALITSLEEDFRSFAARIARTTTSNLLPDDVRERALFRRLQDDEDDDASTPPQSDLDLIEYTDFADISKILSILSPGMTADEKHFVQLIRGELESLAPCRNRVCHSRPLEPDDFAALYDFTAKCISFSPATMLLSARTLDRLKSEPSFVLALKIPAFWYKTQPSIPQNNLPIPDFDDTGFLGRDGDRKQLFDLLTRAPNTVITVFGEGGVGKTALALRSIYDIIDRIPDRYDGIIWTSLKQKYLSVAGIREINQSLDGILGVVTNIADNLDAKGATLPELIAEIKEHMAAFNLLLVIDNLESLNNFADVEALLEEVPPNSKVLITSRIGLGQYERRFQLLPLDEATAVKLTRRFARYVNEKTVFSLPDADIRRITNSLFNNPLLIKWFITAVSHGMPITAIITKKAPVFAQVLEFCFENVISRIGNDERKILEVLYVAQKPLSNVEIDYYLQESITDIDAALSRLISSCLIRRGNRSGTSSGYSIHEYSLSEIANKFIGSTFKGNRELITAIRKKQKDMIAISDTAYAKLDSRVGYSKQVVARTPDERICAAKLLKAMRILKDTNPNYDEAFELISKANELLPSYSEIHRVEGYFWTVQDITHKADEAYARACELDPKSEQALISYARFLIDAKGAEDYHTALELLERCLAIAPANSLAKTTHAMCLMRLGRYDEAQAEYDQLLSDVSKQPRGSSRIAMRDQAAECARRQMERALDARDADTFLNHFKRATDIIISGIRAREYDEKTFGRLSKVLSEATTFVLGNPAPQIAEHFQRVIDDIQPLITNQRLNIDRFDELSARCGIRVGNVLITTPPARGQDIDSVGQTIEGAVQKKIQQGYGFIIYGNSVTTFFHRTALTHFKDWERLAPGTRVRFTLSKNKKGTCASNISILP